MAKIKIHGELGWEVWPARVLDEISNIRDEDIEVSIHSPGGDMFGGIAIYNALKNHSSKVVVKVEGLAASAASLIAMAGDEIDMPENAWLMIHNPSMAAYGDNTVLEEAAELLNRFNETYAKIYASRTGNTVEDVLQMLKETTWMNGKEAKEKGFCDKVIDDVEIKAFARLPKCVSENCPVIFSELETSPEPPKADVEANAAEIVELCAIAGKIPKAAKWIREGTPSCDVRAQLAKMVVTDRSQIPNGSRPDKTAELEQLAESNLTVRGLLKQGKTEHALKYLK